MKKKSKVSNLNGKNKNKKKKHDCSLFLSLVLFSQIMNEMLTGNVTAP